MMTTDVTTRAESARGSTAEPTWSSSRSGLRISRLASFASTMFGDSGNTSVLWNYTDVIDPYAKASDRFCIMRVLGICLGPGALYLPGAIGFCGYVPGFILLCLLHWLQVALAHRIIEAPAVLRMDLEL